MSEGTEKPPPSKRLFIAIGLPEAILKSLAELQFELKRFARDAKWVQPDGIHLTLKFLGYVDPSRVEEISASLSRVTAGCPPAPIGIHGCGAFPNTRRPNVLWAGVESEQLLEIQSRVDDQMAALGFEKEKRAFTPHLTLARFREPRGLAPLMLLVEKKRDVPLGNFTASKIRLYESILHRGGAEYHILKEYPLEGTQWM